MPRPDRPSPRSGRGRRPGRCRSRTAIRRPRPGPDRTCRTAADRASSGTPGPASSTVRRTNGSDASGSATIRIAASGGVYLIAFSIAFVSASSRKTGSTSTGGASSVDLERPVAQPRSQPFDRLADEVVELEDVPFGAQRAGLDPAQVEQVRDEPIEVLDLAVDRVGALLLIVRRSGRCRDEACRPRPGSSPAASAGRARPTAAGPTSGRRSGGRSRRPATRRRGGRARGPGRSGRRRPTGAASRSGRARRRPRCAQRPDRAELPGARLDPDPVGIAPRLAARYGPGPAGGRGSSARASRPGVRWSTWWSPGIGGRGSAPGVGGDPLPGVVRAERDPDPVHGRLVAKDADDRPAGRPASTRGSRARG